MTPVTEQERVIVSDSVTCQCVKWHRPKIRIIDYHHIIPLSWDGPNVQTNIIAICPNQHRLVHELLTLYKKREGFVTSKDLQNFPRFTRELAKRGWDGYVVLKEGKI